MGKLTDKRSMLKATTALLQFVLLLNVASAFQPMPVDVDREVNNHQPEKILAKNHPFHVNLQTGRYKLLDAFTFNATTTIKSSCLRMFPDNEKERRDCFDNIDYKTGLVDIAHTSGTVSKFLAYLPLSVFRDIYQLADLPLSRESLKEFFSALLYCVSRSTDVSHVPSYPQGIKQLIGLDRARTKLATEIISLNSLDAEEKAMILLNNELLKLPNLDALNVDSVQKMAGGVDAPNANTPTNAAAIQGLLGGLNGLNAAELQNILSGANLPTNPAALQGLLNGLNGPNAAGSQNILKGANLLTNAVALQELLSGLNGPNAAEIQKILTGTNLPPNIGSPVDTSSSIPNFGMLQGLVQGANGPQALSTAELDAVTNLINQQNIS